jgi:transmembrane sensor
MADQLDWKLLDRYLAGEATPAETAQVRRWIDAEPHRAGYLEALRRQVPEEGISSAPDVEAGWRRVAARIHAENAAGQTPVIRIESAPSRTKRSFAHGTTRWLVPAAAALLVAASLSLWRVRRDSPESVRRELSSTTLRELTTPNGRRASLVLGDGSRVVLNAGSRLRYAADFGRTGAAREVQLDGEAYFEVTHDATRPFRVHAGNALAQDLGTRFSISAYPGSHAQVVVAEGKVSLRLDKSQASDSAVLGAGERGRLEVSRGATSVARVTVDTVDAARYLSWTTGTLALDDVPLRDAIPVLQRWFDVDIRLADSSLANRRVTASFRDEPVSQVLDALAVALGARYERSGADRRVVTFFAARRGS